MSMSNGKFFQHPFYGEREQLIYSEISEELDSLEETLEQLYRAVMVKIMKSKLSDKDLTVQDVLNMKPNDRQDIVAAILYIDGLWRIEAAYIMLCIGHLNVAYSNLRSCMECVVAANIAENIDKEAVNFLNGEKINLSKLDGSINVDYNKQIKDMKEKLGEWGVHSSVISSQLVMFGPNTFDRMVSRTRTPRTQSLVSGFKDAALNCVKAHHEVFKVFMFLVSRGRISDKSQ